MTKTATILFDLDDTLLQTNLDQFLPAYFQVLSKAFAELAPQEKIVSQIYYAVKKMIENEDPGLILKDIFAQHFYELLGTTEQSYLNRVKDFYKNEYPKLRTHTKQNPEAKALIDWCKTNDFALALATNPLFPTIATRQRIEWAGLEPDDFSFFSTYDNFHFTKPNLAYYGEVLGRLGWPDPPIVMVGDDLLQDLLPVKTMGYDVFYINSNTKNNLHPQGSLSDFKRWAENAFTEDRRGIKDNFEVNLAILRSTPAVIHSWVQNNNPLSQSSPTNNHNKDLYDLITALLISEKSNFSTKCRELTGFQGNGSPEITNYFDTLFTEFLHLRKNNISAIEHFSNQGVQNANGKDSINQCRELNQLLSAWAKNDRVMLRQFFNNSNI